MRRLSILPRRRRGADRRARPPTPPRARTGTSTSRRRSPSAGVLARLDDGRFHGERAAHRRRSSAPRSTRPGRPTAGSRAVAGTLRRDRLGHRLRRAPGRAARPHRRRRPRAGRRPQAGLNPPRTLRHRGRRPLPRSANEPPGRRRRARALPVGADHPRRGRALAGDVLDSGDWAVENARAQLSAFSLPAYGATTKRALRVAVSKIGMPYIWGGETDRSVEPRSASRPTAATTARASSGARSSSPASPRARASAAAPRRRWRARSARASASRLEDVRARRPVFFGTASFGAKATEASVDHVGIALSEHWMIHSSAQGVYVSSLDDELAPRPLHLGPPGALNPTPGAVRRPPRQATNGGMNMRRNKIAAGLVVVAVGVGGVATTVRSAALRPPPTSSRRTSRSSSSTSRTIRAKAGKVTLSMSQPVEPPARRRHPGQGQGQDRQQGRHLDLLRDAQEGHLHLLLPRRLARQGRDEGQADRQLMTTGGTGAFDV